MAVPPGWRRLHRLREAEERQKNAALVSAIQELNRLESAMQSVHDRATSGRAILNEGLNGGEPEDRIAGSEEIAAANRLAGILSARIRQAKENIARTREQFLAVRIQKRQVETLLDLAIARDHVDAQRKSQTALDEWYRSRLERTSSNHSQETPEAGQRKE